MASEIPGGFWRAVADGFIQGQPNTFFRRPNLKFGQCLAGLWPYLFALSVSAAHAQTPPRYYWIVVTEQPDHTVLTVSYDRDTGAVICREKHEVAWFDVTGRRISSDREEQTGKWNQNFRRNAFRYWAMNGNWCDAGIRASDGIEAQGLIEDWWDGKRLVALARTYENGDMSWDKKRPEPPSEWVEIPADILKKLRGIRRIK
jgi:hypothetical protein